MSGSYVERQLITAYQQLDLRIADGDSAGATSCCQRIADLQSQSTSNFGPAWLADIVKSKGLRLRYLEDALRVDKVVLRGDIKLKHGLLDALAGKKPFAIDQVKVELLIEF